MHDEVAQAADVTGDHRAAVCHRLRTDDAEALPPRGAGDHRCPTVEPNELIVRHEAERPRDLVPQGAVARHDEWETVRSGDELPHALLGRQSARVEDLGRLGFLLHRSRQVDSARDRPHVSGAEVLCLVCERGRRRNHEPCTAKHSTREPRSPPSQLDVGPPHLDDEWLPRRHRHQPGGKPVGVHEVGSGSSPAGRAREATQHERQRGGQIWAPAEVSRHPRAVGDAVMPEARRRDDLHLDPALPQVFDLVGDEEAGDVPGPARVRRRQDRDVQLCSRRSKTRGVASASRASA